MRWLQMKGIQRHVACLALNNLSIPFENKRMMMFGSASRYVKSGLCHVISEQNSDSFMALICFMNLSFLQSGVTKSLHFSPSDDAGFVSPLTNPKSLVRILEGILTTYPNMIKTESKKRNYWRTIQRKICNTNSNIQENNFRRTEFLRWIYSLLKNHTICEQNCNLLGMTEIPKCATDIIYTSNQPSSSACWSRESIEDFALFCIVNMSQCSVSRQSLMNINQAVYMMKPIMTAENMQGMKATLACTFLADDWTVLPQSDGCQPTISQITITEMMVKVFERKEDMMDKQQNQQYCTFTTTTVMKSYRDLAILASRYENNHVTEKCIEILAKPSYISICLQTIAEVVFSTLDGSDDSSNINAAYAIEAIEALLPSIMQVSNGIEDETKTSDKAAMGISELLSTYADVNSNIN